MPKKNQQFRNDINDLFDDAFHSALIEKIMRVLIEKHDNGKRSAYTYQGRKFEIILKEIDNQQLQCNGIMTLICSKCGKSDFKVDIDIDMATMYSTGLKIEINIICKTCQTVYHYNNSKGVWEPK